MTTNSRLALFFAPILLAGLATGCGATPEIEDNAASTDVAEEALSSRCAPSVDPTIAVPAGNALAFSLDAIGVQIYSCNATDTGAAWTFQAPEAQLFERHRNVGKHYAGPTWEYKDGSKIVGAKLAAVTPDATAIPWLLLKVSAHDGEGKLAAISYVQRLATTAGLAPAAATCTTANVGEVARVNYSATYYFYKAGAPSCGCK